MQPPSSVRIGPYTYTVRIESEVSDATQCWGRVQYESQVIYLNSRNTVERHRETLWHEIKHIVNILANVNDESDEEALTKRQSPYELMVLRDNPELIQFLTADTGRS